MFELSHILTPVDHSQGSRYALELGQFLAQAYKAKTLWAHVVAKLSPLMERVIFPYAALGEDLAEFENELLKTAKSTLSGVVGQEALDDGRVLIGHTVQTLLDEVRRVGPELLVLGATGEANPSAVQLGSTASRIAERWDGPTILARPFSGERPFSAVVVATDLAPGSEAVVRCGIGVALQTDTPLQILTALPDPRDGNTGPLVRDAIRIPKDQLRSKGQKNARKQFEQILSMCDIPFPQQEGFKALKPSFGVRIGTIADCLREHLDGQGEALVVVGRRSGPSTDKLGIGPNAQRITQTVPAHVLLAPVR